LPPLLVKGRQLITALHLHRAPQMLVEFRQERATTHKTDHR